MFTTWIAFVVFAIIAAWLWSGFEYFAPGIKGVFTFLGNMTNRTIEEEGWKYAPFPFGFLKADCHQRTIKLDDLKDVVTLDGILVTISGSVIVETTDVKQNLRTLDPATFKKGLDDFYDQEIRSYVGKKPLTEVQRMKDILADTVKDNLHSHTSLNWGVTVRKVLVSEVRTDESVREDQERQEREELQRNGQRVQAEWTGQLERYFAGEAPLTPGGTLGPKLPAEMAHELTLYTLELAEKKKVESKTFGLDVTTAAAVTAALNAISKGGRQ